MTTLHEARCHLEAVALRLAHARPDLHDLRAAVVRLDQAKQPEAAPITAAESVASEEHTGQDLLGEISRLRVALEITETERKDRALENADLRVQIRRLEEERDAANVAAGRMRIELENLRRDTTRAA